jgi:hypothetical protein
MCWFARGVGSLGVRRRGEECKFLSLIWRVTLQKIRGVSIPLVEKLDLKFFGSLVVSSRTNKKRLDLME